eukprot:717312-Hanusia_phi.AAC.2
MPCDRLITVRSSLIMDSERRLGCPGRPLRPGLRLAASRSGASLSRSLGACRSRPAGRAAAARASARALGGPDRDRPSPGRRVDRTVQARRRVTDRTLEPQYDTKI